jgi:hypothetical protein
MSPKNTNMVAPITQCEFFFLNVSLYVIQLMGFKRGKTIGNMGVRNTMTTKCES